MQNLSIVDHVGHFIGKVAKANAPYVGYEVQAGKYIKDAGEVAADAALLQNLFSVSIPVANIVQDIGNGVTNVAKANAPYVGLEVQAGKYLMDAGEVAVDVALLQNLFDMPSIPVANIVQNIEGYATNVVKANAPFLSTEQAVASLAIQAAQAALLQNLFTVTIPYANIAHNIVGVATNVANINKPFLPYEQAAASLGLQAAQAALLQNLASTNLAAASKAQAQATLAKYDNNGQAPATSTTGSQGMDGMDGMVINAGNLNTALDTTNANKQMWKTHCLGDCNGFFLMI